MIHIFYRHYNVEGNDNVGHSGLYRNRPSWFSYEKCFTNLLDTIEGKDNVKLHVVFDGNVKDNFIWKYKDKYTLHSIKAGNDAVSFSETVKYAHSLDTNDNDIIYFVENDYVHLPEWVDKVTELFGTYKLSHYVSLYDHKDKYTYHAYDNLVSKILLTDTHHWRTTPSTCGTFMMTKQLLNEDFDIQSTMKGDHNKFLYLTQERNRHVITPIPSLCTHGMDEFLAPTIDWEKVINNAH